MPDDATTTPGASVHITHEVAPDPKGGWRLTVTVHNGQATDLHLLDTPRIPYRTVEQGVVVLRWSLRPPPEGMASGWLEEPSSRAVKAGASVELEAHVAWPLTLEDHYLRARPYVGELPQPLRARIEVGHLSRELTPSRASDLSLQALLDEQRVAQGAPFALPQRDQ